MNEADKKSEPGLRCLDADACALGQKPCPTPEACGCEPPAPQMEPAPQLDQLHNLLYSAQRYTGEAQAKAIGDARLLLSKLMAARHPDDAAVDALATLMKAKLAKQRAKGCGGWDDKTQCPQQRLSAMLRNHVDKGDPVDVANFCAMLSARGEGIAAAPQAVQAAVPDDYALRLKIERGLMERSLDEWVEQTGAVTLNSSWHSELASIVQMAFDKGAEVRSAHPAEGVPSCVAEGEREAFEQAFVTEKLRLMDCGESDSAVHAIRMCHLKRYGDDEYPSLEACFAWFAWKTRAALSATQPAAQGLDAVRELIALHSKELEQNAYAYFELAHTRQTGWCAWITDHPRSMPPVPVINPDRKVIASGQGDTPDAACAAALAAQAKQGGA